MRVVIQRVTKTSVKCSTGHYDEIGKGMLVLLGIEEADNIEDISWLCGKICRLRIFDDSQGVMNFGLNEIEGELMVISQFTLHASTKKGNRPSYIKAAPPDVSKPRYEEFLIQLENTSGIKVKHGVFGDEMEVSLVNDGPVTIIMDSRNRE
jgi:D-tyrosyl-tRNA(Tyr) deacylase